MKKFQIFYILFIHILLLALFFREGIPNSLISSINTNKPEQTSFYEKMLIHHDRMDESIPNQAILFIGDSITQELAVSSIVNKGVNLGIGNDTTSGVINRLPKYDSIKRASGVVLAIGVNDLRWRNDNEILGNYNHILNLLPETLPLIVSLILPVNESVEKFSGYNARIMNINMSIASACEAKPTCTYIDAGPELIDNNGDLSERYHAGDGIHLNSEGYAIWIKQLRNGLGKGLYKDDQ